MERLTVYTPDGYESINPVDLCLDEYSDINFKRILDKLGAYEDFEEIFREKMTSIACDVLNDKEEFGKWLDRNKWIAKKCDEWARAEEQGRLVILPCKVGDTVYTTTWWDDVQEKVVVKGKTYYRTVHNHKVTKSTFSYSDINDFGKTVFLTKPEAEAKRKELRGNNDEI